MAQRIGRISSGKGREAGLKPVYHQRTRKSADEIQAECGARPVRMPSVREVLLVQGLLEGKTESEAATDAGYSSQSSVTGIKKKGRLSELLAVAGITIESLAVKLNEGLAAYKIEFAKVNGEITDQVSCADFGTRHRYLETALRLLGFGANANFSEQAVDEIDRLLDELEGERNGSNGNSSGQGRAAEELVESDFQ